MQQDENKQSIGRRIAILRKEKGWTQSELAAKLGVSDKAVSKWEKDVGAPSIEFFPALSDLFGVDIDYLMTGKSDFSKQIFVGSVSDDKLEKEAERIVASSSHFIQDGIISIQKLEKIDNSMAVEKLLSLYPIHPIEARISAVKEVKKDICEGKWREAFQKSVDNEFNEIASMIVERSAEEDWKGALQSLERKIIEELSRIEEERFHPYCNQNIFLIKKISLRFSPNTPLSKIEDKIRQLKKDLILDAKFRQEKTKITEGLTKEYFLNELKTGNFELVIVKLCVKLEAILRYTYRYEGDFAEMLKRYCDEKLHYQEDDGWGYNVWTQDDRTIKALNDLREVRNNVVHADSRKRDLTLDELKYCIEYICKMG